MQSYNENRNLWAIILAGARGAIISANATDCDTADLKDAKALLEDLSR